MPAYANDTEHHAALSHPPALYTPEIPGILPGRYALPRSYDYPGSNEARERLDAYLSGRADISTLQPDELDFIRDDINRQIIENRSRAIHAFNQRVPRRYRDVDHTETQAATWAHRFAHDPENTPSLFILGATGTGKTHQAYAILKAVAVTGTSAAFGWRATTAADLYASLRPRQGADSEAEFRSIAKASLLFVDDLGAAKVTEWTEEITYRLINHRYEQCLPSIFTSNVRPSELRDAVGDRVASRLNEMCERLLLDGDDRRRKPKQ